MSKRTQQEQQIKKLGKQPPSSRRKKVAPTKVDDEEPVKFFARHFWKLMEDQNGRCALTGRELTPDNTEVELREPYRAENRTDFDNHYLIVRTLAHTARYVDEKQIIELAAEIIQYRGKEIGYGLKKIKR